MNSINEPIKYDTVTATTSFKHLLMYTSIYFDILPKSYRNMFVPHNQTFKSEWYSILIMILIKL